MTLRAERVVLAKVIHLDGRHALMPIAVSEPRFNGREQVDALHAWRLANPGHEFKLLVEIDG